MNFDEALKEADARMQASAKRVQEQMQAMQKEHERIIAESIVKMEEYMSPEKIIDTNPKSELVTTDSGEEMLVLNLDAVAVLKNILTLMDDVITCIK